MRQLLAKQYWIFDMDGTLTLNKHDFMQMRKDLGLPDHQTILESLAQLPPEQSVILYERLQAMELDIAQQTEPATGANKLLTYLAQRGKQVGILTRNSLLNTEITLKAAGLDHFFPPENIISRDCAPIKPSPVGIELLLQRWQGQADAAVMVGDFLYDLQAGRAAGATTLYIDTKGEFPHRNWADVCLTSLGQLLTTITP